MNKSKSIITKKQISEILNSELIDDKVYVINDIINNVTHQKKYFLKLYKNQDITKVAGFVETHTSRKLRLLNKYPKPFNYIYYSGDFLLTRVSPKLKFTKNLYFTLSKGKGHVLSKTEILGKLYYCGFEIIEECTYNHKWYFLVQKKENHQLVDYIPKKGIIITLPRIGKNGKTIKVYKFRTMHPYAEFIQEYVYQNNDLKEGGKLQDDFRINTIGKFMRKYWIDELPMIINVFKGEMKLIGVRPLSAHYLSLYSPELQELRTKTKPGLLPPFYVDNPKTLEEIQTSELKYLRDYQKSPLRTDIKYFFAILNNIIFKGKRSG